MAYESTSSPLGSTSTLTAFFDRREQADEAVAELIEEGVPQAFIRVVAGNEGAGASGEAEHKGFWDSLADFFMPDEDRYSYAEGLRRGGYIVTVTGLSPDDYAVALDILDDEGAVDLDERAASWRTEGWTGYTPAERRSSGLGAVGADAERIPVIEEQLKVGKRDVNLGRVRVRSYVVEEPVSEDISLRDERVVIERRPVDRAVNAADASFEDRVIEAEEHREEAVISKEARVVEEIGIRKETEIHNETISDTVKHTEVEVEDDRENSNRFRTDR